MAGAIGTIGGVEAIEVGRLVSPYLREVTAVCRTILAQKLARRIEPMRHAGLQHERSTRS